MPSGEYKILVVEDDRITRLAMDRLVEAFGHVSHMVENGQEALEVLQNTSFDLILMDDQMPLLSGFDTALAIRRGDAGVAVKDIPIIILTASVDPANREKFRDAGLENYLSKPVDMDQLEKTIELVMKPAC